MLDKITRTLKPQGIDLIGVSCVNEGLPPELAHFSYGLTIGIALLNGIIDGIKSGPTHTYFSHYRTVNAQLDRCALIAAKMLEEKGAKAFTVPASQSIGGDGLHGIVSHKFYAVRAGLGYIGKSALFVSNAFGPRVRLATILTDYPLTEKEPLVSGNCGSCTVCMKACPAGAISGREYVPGMARDDFFDALKCSRYMKDAYKDIGRGAVCGICMAVCPKGLH